MAATQAEGKEHAQMANFHFKVAKKNAQVAEKNKWLGLAGTTISIVALLVNNYLKQQCK